MEITHIFSTSKARFIVVEPELLAKVLPAAAEKDIPHPNIFTLNAHGQDLSKGFESLDALLNYGEEGWHTLDDKDECKNTTAALFSTSGTTGLPKAAAVLDAAMQNRMCECLHYEGILAQVWGLSEAGGWITTFQYPEKDLDGSVGRLLPTIMAKIVDESGHDLEDDGAQGEILIRTPSVMTAYVDQVEATERTIVDGWLQTGDIGYQKAGKCYIVDRAKEIIKVRGWQVSPTGLERCLLTHPAIADAVVIGVDLNDGRGELPRAYIVMKQIPTADAVTDQDILAHMKVRLAQFKALRGGICRVRSIPKSLSGKILKNERSMGSEMQMIVRWRMASLVQRNPGPKVRHNGDNATKVITADIL
ncbi:MAG: hypothetical protein Q9217_004080 [Psora testacea]